MNPEYISNNPAWNALLAERQNDPEGFIRRGEQARRRLGNLAYADTSPKQQQANEALNQQVRGS